MSFKDYTRARKFPVFSSGVEDLIDAVLASGWETMVEGDL